MAQDTIFESAYSVGARTFLLRYEKAMPIFSFFKNFVFGGAPILSTEEEILSQYEVRGVKILKDTFRGGSGREFNGTFGYTNKKYTPCYFYYRTRLNRDDFKQAVFGEDITKPLSKSARISAVSAQKAWFFKNSMKATVEKMCADVLFNGVIKHFGDAQGDVAFLENDTEFPVTDNIKTEGSMWTGSTDIYARLIALTEEQFQKSGSYPTHLITGSVVMQMILADSKIQKLLDNRRMYVGSIDIKRLNKDGVAEVGDIALPNGCELKLMTYVGFYKGDDNSNIAYMPTNKILLCSRAIGQMGYAALEGIDANGDPTLVPGENYIHIERTQSIPVTRIVGYQSAPLPMPQKLDGWMAVQVLS